MADEMAEIIDEFVVEAKETLEKIDPMFVNLETKGYDKDIIDEIFRGMHTIKGAAGFLGLGQVVDVAHRAESIMKRLRDGEVTLNKDLTDVILKSVDALRLLVSHIKLKNGMQQDVSGILNELDTALKSTTVQEVVKTEWAVEEITKETGEKVQLPKSESMPEPQSMSIPAPTIKDQVQKVTKESEVTSTLRVDVTRIDKVMDLVGEIVLVRNRLLNLASKLDINYSDDPHVENLLETTGFLDRVTSDLQLAVMKIRMQPIQKVFNKFPRMVRDMSKTLNKDIDLEIFGEGTEVDKTVMENIGDPLVHIIRNSIDHAIELPKEREIKGKPQKGKIIVSAHQKGSQIVIEVSDDGKGIDVEAVRKKALSKDVITEQESEKMSDDAVTNLIFLPGFSTKAVSTELSGRGVGMDAVKTNVAKLNGYVEVITKKDIGSTFRISLPLTLAIIYAVMVQIGDEYYAIPQSIIEETLRIKKSDISSIIGQRAISIRGKVLPLFEMSDLLDTKRKSDFDQGNSYVLVAAVGERKFCIAVDKLLGQEEIVIKSINGVESDECGVLGATITGDGKVVLILDIAVLTKKMFTTK